MIFICVDGDLGFRIVFLYGFGCCDTSDSTSDNNYVHYNTSKLHYNLPKAYLLVCCGRVIRFLHRRRFYGHSCLLAQCSDNNRQRA